MHYSDRLPNKNIHQNWSLSTKEHHSVKNILQFVSLLCFAPRRFQTRITFRFLPRSGVPQGHVAGTSTGFLYLGRSRDTRVKKIFSMQLYKGGIQ